MRVGRLGDSMSDNHDFERAWLAKFARSLAEIAGEAVRGEVMNGSESLSSRSCRREVIAWSRIALRRLESLVDDEKRKAIMTGCACIYPASDLADVRRAYEMSGDIDLAHRMLQEKFESFLGADLRLADDLAREVIKRGWGLAGIRKGGTIIATKIPKSENLLAYLEEKDPEKKRYLYCHCPRIRDVLNTSETMPAIYCYCGAGFYKAIWEEILQRRVRVEVLKSVLKGDEICSIAVYLPGAQ
jgi:hypothetical protein